MEAREEGEKVAWSRDTDIFGARGPLRAPAWQKSVIPREGPHPCRHSRPVLSHMTCLGAERGAQPKAGGVLQHRSMCPLETHPLSPRDCGTSACPCVLFSNCLDNGVEHPVGALQDIRRR